LDRIGPFAGYSRASGDVSGSIEGVKYKFAGTMEMQATNVGAYWTHVSSSGWYVDGVAMGGWVTGTPRSTHGVNTHVDGRGVTLSLESGYPYRLNETLQLEPMGQIVWQRASFDSLVDPISSVSFRPDDSWHGRLGARLEDNRLIEGVP